MTLFWSFTRSENFVKEKMHFYKDNISPLLREMFIVVTLIILLGDAGNPKSLRARKGKILM